MGDTARIVDANTDGHRLLQFGAGLLLAGLLVGLGVPRFAVPRLALSTHLLGIMQGLFLIVLGLLWPRLVLSRGPSGLGRVLAIYGCASAWVANLAGALWGAGGSMVPIATGGVRGTPGQEAVIRILLVSAAVSLIGATLVVLWGLRSPRRGVVFRQTTLNGPPGELM